MKLAIIQQSIFEVRGQKVMFDFDLAELYGVETKRLKEAVKRNKKKFPPDFMFELTKKEWANLRTQFATSSWGGLRYLPYAFTEHSVTMLASILNSDRFPDDFMFRLTKKEWEFLRSQFVTSSGKDEHATRRKLRPVQKSGADISNHFVGVNKIVDLGSG